MGGCWSASAETWEESGGGPFKCFSLFYDIHGLEEWDPRDLQERIIKHPSFARVGECKVSIEQKPNGRHEVEFRKPHPWKNKTQEALDKMLDQLPGTYHWWGVVNIRPHLKKRTAATILPGGDTLTVRHAVAISEGKGGPEMGERVR